MPYSHLPGHAVHCSYNGSKINSTVVSIFTSSYVFHWGDHFPSTPLRYPPSFDSRVVLYPGSKEVRDYFAWRQADSKCRRNSSVCISNFRADLEHI